MRSSEICADVLTESAKLGLRQVENAGRELALQRFEEVAKTEGFMQMNEGVEGAIGSLLEDDALIACREEAVHQALVKWMNGREEAIGVEAAAHDPVLSSCLILSTLLWMCIIFSH